MIIDSAIWYIRVVLLIFFVYTIYRKNSEVLTNESSPQDIDPNLSNYMMDNPNDKYVNPTKYDQPLPLINRSALSSETKWAMSFLRMPTWSFGYNQCDSESTEVSCYELFRSAKVIKQWENLIRSKKTIGSIYVDVNNQSISFADKLSMLYFGLQIAVVTNRELVTNKKIFIPILLPDSIRDPLPNEKHGKLLVADHSFNCVDVSDRFPNLYFNGPSYPQVLYTHPAIAPKLRENFGFHAAHLMGNYLFGQTEKPESKCTFDSPQTVVEGWVFHEDKQILRPDNYSKYLPRCGVTSQSSSMVTNEKEFNSKYKDVFKFNDKSNEETLCAFRKITSAKKIVQTFGSRFGFWATALQGSKGSFVNGIDNICANLTNSQQGSLWHTYCPFEKRSYLYRSNTHFFLCGNNLEDAKLFIDYLLW